MQHKRLSSDYPGQITLKIPSPKAAGSFLGLESAGDARAPRVGRPDASAGAPHTHLALPARRALSRAPHGPHPHTHRAPQESRSGRWDAGQVLTWRRRRLSTGLPHAGGQTPEPTSKEVPTQGPDGGSPHGSLGLRTSAGHVPGGGEELGARRLLTDGGPSRRLRPADADHSEERCRRGPCSFTSREARRLTTRPHKGLRSYFLSEYRAAMAEQAIPPVHTAGTHNAD